MDFKGKNAVVTGGSSGIGLKLVGKFLYLGAENVGIFDIVENKNAIQNLKNEFKNKSIDFYKTDIRSRDEIRQSFFKFAQKHRFVDVLVNSAGICNENKPNDTILINLNGLISTTYEAMEFMSIAKGGGRGGIVINIASISGILYLPYLPVYNASKHGVMAFTKSMANDINRNVHGIRYIVICPGVTATPLTKDSKALFTEEYMEMGLKEGGILGLQTTDELLNGFDEIIPKAENGSAWIINCSTVKEFHFPEYKL